MKDPEPKADTLEETFRRDVNHSLNIIDTCLTYLFDRFNSYPSVEGSDGEPVNPFKDYLNTIEKLISEVNTIREDIHSHKFSGSLVKAPDDKEGYGVRETLVDLMVLSLQCWEQSGRGGKVELAEKSAIWNVYIDNGRLVTRTMDRYLNIHTLPKKPRVKSVMKTVYFVLNHVKSDTPARKKLEEQLYKMQKILEQQAFS